MAGDAGPNIIHGGDGIDQIWGRDSADQLYGEIGDDVLYGNAGGDYLHGGPGNGDYASYLDAPTGVAADLQSPVGYNSGDALGDQYVEIENLQGSQQGDSLKGNAGNNTILGNGGLDNIWGRDGNDQLYGEDGDDFLNGGVGADLINGGNGIDFATYGDAPSAVTADLFFHAGTLGDANGDTYNQIENLQGSAYDDHLSGDNLPNALYGGTGQ